jgi:hypothetical protein
MLLPILMNVEGSETLFNNTTHTSVVSTPKKKKKKRYVSRLSEAQLLKNTLIW